MPARPRNDALLFENNKRISQSFPSSGTLRDGLVDLSTAMEPPWLTLVDEPLHIMYDSKFGIFRNEVEFVF